MTMLTIVSVLVGALLGIRFKVFILLPAVLLAVAVVTAVGLSRESGVWWIALEIVVIMTALELGYLGGSLAARIWSRSRKARRAREEGKPDDHPTEDQAGQSRIFRVCQNPGKVNQQRGGWVART